MLARHILVSRSLRPGDGRLKPTSARRRVVGFVLKALATVLVVLTPLFGAWFASSLAAYANRSSKLAAVCGLLLFPILPVVWELVARHRERKSTRRRILTVGDRLLLRTLGINVVFLGVLLGTMPAAAVRAVSARGDWMLDGHDGTFARGARRVLLDVADSFDWLYRGTHAIEVDGDHPTKRKGNEPPPLPRGDTIDDHGDGSTAPPEDVPAPPIAAFDAAHPWPSAPDIDPRVRTVPPASEATIPLLAAFLSALEADPYRRFKLLHDWVADHVSYDFPALDDGSYVTKQDAAKVLLARTGVCAGYANLLVELGRAAGYVIDYVGGVAKGAGGEVDGGGHAWNVVVIDKKSWLVDATWDAGHAKQNSSDHDRFTKDYKTDYLFTPPDVFGADHFPEDAKWQLRDKPITRGEFMRIPQLDPSFVAHGWKLVSPDRSQITVKDHATAMLESDGRHFLLASLFPQTGGVAKRCSVDAEGSTVKIDCTAPAPGTYRLVFFDSPKRYGTYGSIGELNVLAQ
ncbi:hypothetical protein BH09MYX1_BH09MYX1_34600 [soil metagenome]